MSGQDDLRAECHAANLHGEDGEVAILRSAQMVASGMRGEPLQPGHQLSYPVWQYVSQVGPHSHRVEAREGRDDNFLVVVLVMLKKTHPRKIEGHLCRVDEE